MQNQPIPSPLIDIHCHAPKPAEHLQILSLDTHELAHHHDTPPLGLSAPRGPSMPFAPNAYFSLGIHPWHIDTQDIDTAMQTFETCRHQPKLLAIGECGLDKCIATPLSRQAKIFERQIELAEHWQKPMIIHCVRAFNELMQTKKTANALVPWIIHGFNGSPELAEQLLEQDCYLSLGKALLNPKSKASLLLRALPLDRLFLETDAAIDVPIGAIYTAAAKIRGSTVANLRQEIFDNFKRVFSDD